MKFLSSGFSALFLTLGLQGMTPSHAHTSLDIHKADVDSLAKTLIKKTTVGLMVGIVNPEGVEYYGYGRTASAGVVPDENTVFEIGSVTKTFTCLALSLGIQNKEFQLSDTLQSHMPKRRIPEFKGTKITLEHLVTHHSGLPLMPDNFSSEGTFSNENLWQFLSKCQLKFKPGTQYLYSNVGLGALGLFLAEKKGCTWEALIKTHVLEPLGMNDSAVTLNADQQRRMVQPHDANLRPTIKLTWKPDALIGSGGICSTAKDMLKFINAQLAPIGTMSAAIEQTHQMLAEASENRRIGMAWFKRDTDGFFFHDGRTAGCTSWISFDKRNHTGVILLSNSNNLDPITAMGTALQKKLSGLATEESE